MASSAAFLLFSSAVGLRTVRVVVVVVRAVVGRVVVVVRAVMGRAVAGRAVLGAVPMVLVVSAAFLFRPTLLVTPVDVAGRAVATVLFKLVFRTESPFAAVVRAVATEEVVVFLVSGFKFKVGTDLLRFVELVVLVTNFFATTSFSLPKLTVAFNEDDFFTAVGCRRREVVFKLFRASIICSGFEF